MGTFNKKLPVTETRFDMVPAEPGWFVFDWSGSLENYTLRKAPIIAWLVETELYPQIGWKNVPKPDGTMDSISRPTGEQDSFTSATAVSPGGFDCDTDTVLGPDGVVYKLPTGDSWPDIPSFIKADIEHWDEENRKDEERRLKASAQKTQS